MPTYHTSGVSPCIDLLKILQHYADTMAPQGSDPAYWICTFANNQHRVDLGTHWKKSILAEKTCTMVTMVTMVTMACSRLTEAIEASEILIHMT